MKELAKCFYEIFDKSKPHTVMDAGLRVIEVRRITGTLDKCGELDESFRYVKRRDRGERSRWHRLREAAGSFQFFPPIDAVFYKGEYYVVDGNRRVAAAKALAVEYIDANVKEYVLRDDAESASGTLSRRRFESQTGLKNVILYGETGYAVLLDEISRRAEEGGARGRDLRPVARAWHSSFYIPAISDIGNSELSKRFPALAPGDILVLILRFYRDCMGGLPGGVSFQTAMSGFVFARALPQRRPLRFFPFRVLQTLLTGRRESEGFAPGDGRRPRRGF